VRDLIDSQTLFQAKVAAQQLEGALSNRLKPIKNGLLDLIALLEAGIDFAEDDISVASDATILDRIARFERRCCNSPAVCLWQDRSPGIDASHRGRPMSGSRVSLIGWWSGSGPLSQLSGHDSRPGE